MDWPYDLRKRVTLLCDIEKDSFLKFIAVYRPGKNI